MARRDLHSERQHLFADAGTAPRSDGRNPVNNDDRRSFEEIALAAMHDINNLLVGVIGNTRMMLDDQIMDPISRRRLSQIHSCAKRSAYLTDLVLSASRHSARAKRMKLMTTEAGGSDISLNMAGELEMVGKNTVEELKPGATVQSKPVATAEDASDEAVSATDAAKSTAKTKTVEADTVLIIDDEEVVRDVTAMVLERAGFRVLAGASGEEGLRIYGDERDRIRCVFLDLTMPYMSGNLVFARLKAADPQARVFLMSGFNDSQVLDQFEPGAISGFIRKPFQMEEVIEAARSVA